MARRRSVPGAIPLDQAIDHRALMLLGTAPRPFASPDWGWEVKYDGFRVLAFREGKTARLMSRNGRDVSAAFPEILEGLRSIPRDAVLDGELTVPDEHGVPDFHALRPRALMTNALRIRDAARRTPALLYLFDALASGKWDLRPATLVARRAELEDMVPDETPGICDVQLADDGIALMRAVTARGLEGVVAKKLDSAYYAGRNRCWMKVRAPTARDQTRR